MSTQLFHNIVFGPVHSRRLGISLGVNLLPDDGKLCTFDCIYCECGYNSERKSSHSLPTREEVYNALYHVLYTRYDKGEKLDVITFAGNGEPTLHPQFADIIDDTIVLRNKFFPDAKVSVLSNATRIDREDVYATLRKVDNNILKLDSVFDDTICRINAPVSARFTAAELIRNLCAFEGNLIIQTLFLQGMHNGEIIDNTTEEEVSAWLETIQRISPRQVMIYTIDRDTPEQNLRKASPDILDAIARRVESSGIAVSVSY